MWKWFKKQPADIGDKLDNIEVLLYRLERKMTAELDRLKESVRRNTDAGKAILALVTGLKQQLKDALANQDMSAVQDIADQLDAETQSFVDATLENTPAEPGTGSGTPEEPSA